TPSSMLSGKSPYEMIFKCEPNLSHLKVFGCLCFLTVLNNHDKFSSSSENKDYELELKDLNTLNFFNNDIGEDLSSDPYDDRRDNNSENSKGTDQLSHEGTENTGNANKDDGGLSNDSIPEAAICEDLESAILEDNSSSERDDTDYQEFNNQFQNQSSQFQNQSPVLNPDKQNENLRRSTRKTSMPAKLSDFEVNTKVKYNIDRQVNYSKLSIENYNFSTSLNKISEPKTYSEAAKDIRWIEAMSQEMEALNRNRNRIWIIVDLRLDINNAFLYGELAEDVYMTLPEGYFDKDDKRFCKLVKSLYGPCSTPIKTKASTTKDKKVVVDNYYQDKCKATRKCVTGYSVFLGNNLVSWKRKKQSMLAKSSAEAEYKAMNTITCEVIWINKILTELNVQLSLPVSIHCDNSSAIQIAANLIFHEKTKHFEIELFFLREKVFACSENC
nr:ribonuclease H-like domain-containing protein [Tanacetum cinerariifolium]